MCLRLRFSQRMYFCFGLRSILISTFDLRLMHLCLYSPPFQMASSNDCVNRLSCRFVSECTFLYAFACVLVAVPMPAYSISACICFLLASVCLINLCIQAVRWLQHCTVHKPTKDYGNNNHYCERVNDLQSLFTTFGMHCKYLQSLYSSLTIPFRIILWFVVYFAFYYIASICYAYSLPTFGRGSSV